MLRDPIQRYLSEWKQVQRGGTWLSTKLKCNGRQATLAEVPFCFKGSILLRHLPHCLRAVSGFRLKLFSALRCFSTLFPIDKPLCKRYEQ
jgi:hypothetical protein